MASKGWTRRAAKIAAIVFLVLVLCVGIGSGSGYLGYRAGGADFQYRVIAEVTDEEDRLPLVIDETIGRKKSYALYGQDLWLLHRVYPGRKDGFFVDLGSADGEADSNTKLLETLGWQGICVDPFPSNMTRRSCRMVTEVVDSEAGRTVQFQQPGSFSGGILDYAGWWVDEKAREKTVELTTTTLAEILERAEAPTFIDYISIDIEGAEYEALRTFPFETYSIGALTIEHNEAQERRMAIRRLLEGRGYRLERAILDQDWYVLDQERPDRHQEAMVRQKP